MPSISRKRASRPLMRRALSAFALVVALQLAFGQDDAAEQALAEELAFGANGEHARHRSPFAGLAVAAAAGNRA